MHTQLIDTRASVTLASNAVTGQACDPVGDCGMGKIQADPYFRSIWAQALGVVMGVCLVAPPLIRLNEGRWSGIDWVFVIGGVAYVFFWLSAAIIGWRTRRGGKET